MDLTLTLSFFVMFIRFEYHECIASARRCPACSSLLRSFSFFVVLVFCLAFLHSSLVLFFFSIVSVVILFDQSFGSKKAVAGLSLGVADGEIFGLLGPNGAGKTTTMKLLTGDERLDEGEAWINGCMVPSSDSTVAFSSVTNVSFEPIFAQLGFCPQSDGLITDLSVREHLILFSRYSESCRFRLLSLFAFLSYMFLLLFSV